MQEKVFKELKEAEEKEKGLFYLNLNDFSIFKLRSTIYLIQFPLMYTISILSVWTRILPSSIN
jgi:hypothetical protein